MPKNKKRRNLQNLQNDNVNCVGDEQPQDKPAPMQQNLQFKVGIGIRSMVMYAGMFATGYLIGSMQHGNNANSLQNFQNNTLTNNLLPNISNSKLSLQLRPKMCKKRGANIR